jgi:hypothetical protein
VNSIVSDGICPTLKDQSAAGHCEESAQRVDIVVRE